MSIAPAFISALKGLTSKDVSKNLADMGKGLADAAGNGISDAFTKLESIVTKLGDPAVQSLMALFTAQTATDQANLMKALLELAQSEGVTKAVEILSNLFNLILQGGTSTVNVLTAFSNAFIAAEDDGSKSRAFGSLQTALTASTDRAGTNLNQLKDTMDTAASESFRSGVTSLGTLLGNLSRVSGVTDGINNIIVQMEVRIIMLTRAFETVNKLFDDFIDKITNFGSVLETGLPGTIKDKGSWF